MGDLIRALVEIIGYLWPIRVVKSYQRGVRFIGGREPSELIPGIYWHIPFFMVIDVISIVQDVLDLDNQTVTTRDGKTIVLSANITYRVTDAVAHYTNVEDFATSLPRMACRHIMSKARDWTLDELHAHQKELEASIKTTLNTRLDRLQWGAVVDDCGLTDCAASRSFRLFQ